MVFNKLIFVYVVFYIYDVFVKNMFVIFILVIFFGFGFEIVFFYF